MAAVTVPEFIVMRQEGSNKDKPAYYKEDGSVVYGAQENVFSPLAKIQVEPATINRNYFHLRFCYSNKYWQIKNANDKSIVAVSKQPEEDTTKSSCTLFEPIKAGGPSAGAFYLIHVHTGGAVQLNSNVAAIVDRPFPMVELVDWGTLIKLPPHVAFKGDNGKYLKAYMYKDRRHLQFGSDDANDVLSGHRVELMGDGHIRFFSDYFNRYWRFNPNWIWADSTDATGQDSGTLFWPIKINDSTIALRSIGGYNNFCKRLTTDGITSGLAATVGTITTEARMELEELVLNRSIYNVSYRMEDARIFNEMPYVAGSTSLVNDSDVEASQSVSITYQDEKSYTFSRGFSMTAGVTTTIETGVPFIVQGRIEISFEISGNFQWDTTTTTTRSVTATGSVIVPARSSAIVDFVGTTGTCDVPYSYTQLDQSSADGTTNRITHTDGTYKGVSSYNFNFHVRSTQSL